MEVGGLVVDVWYDTGAERIKLRLLVTETSRNRKKKENRGKIDSHQARLLQTKSCVLP